MEASEQEKTTNRHTGQIDMLHGDVYKRQCLAFASGIRQYAQRLVQLLLMQER